MVAVNRGPLRSCTRPATTMVAANERMQIENAYLR